MDGRWSTLIEGLLRDNWLKINQFRAVVPMRCTFCAGATRGLSVCAACIADLPWRAHQRLRGEHEIYASFRYAFPLLESIGRAKLGGDCGLARQLGVLMATRAPVCGSEVDVVCAVPLAWRRAVRRGYNQALELARPIAGALGCPLWPEALQRVDGQPQRGLGRDARVRNLVGLFSADGCVAGQRVLVIDDVTTTGATFREARRALLAAGATSVLAWAAAAVD